MLRSVKSLKMLRAHALDGEVGEVKDLFFDDEHWVARYLVVRTGGWLMGRDVLLSPISLERADWTAGSLHLNLTRERIENSPGIESHQPVSRQNEAALFRHYGYPYYWGGPFAWGYAVLPVLAEQQVFEDPQRLEIRKEMEEASREDAHLRSCNEVVDYTIAAVDDKLGHLEDFLFDEEDWSIQYLVVDPRNFWPGKHVLIPAHRIEQVYWSDKEVVVDMRRDEVENSPAYDPDNLPPPTGQHARKGTGMQGVRPGA